MLSLALVTAGLFFTGCKGDDGPQGPKGDTGETGATGFAGSKGAQGDPGNTGSTGANGSSNVYYNSSIGGATIPAGTDKYLDVLFDAGMLKFSDIEKTLILLYINVGESWYRVPGDVQTVSGIQTLALGLHRHVDGGVVFRITRTNGPGALTFKDGRVIAIKEGAAGARHGAINYDNYEEVIQHYNLQE